MKNILAIIIVLVVCCNIFAQEPTSPVAPVVEEQPSLKEGCSMLIVPKAPRVRVKRGETPMPKKIGTMEAFICFKQGTAFYNDEALNILDSLYRLAFAPDNNQFYKMTIIGYDDAQPLTEKNTNIARERAVLVFNYFLSRENVTDFIIKRTPSKYWSSCSGETDYFIKYKMPIDFKWINLNGKPDEDKQINGVDVTGKVYVLIEEDLEDCVGEFYNYYFPSKDTTLNSQYSQITIPKGALESITNTKDTVDTNFTITYREVFNFEDLMKDYKFIPSQKQHLINAGYIIVGSNHSPDYKTCALRNMAKPSITIKVVLTEEQVSARLKFYAKVFNADGSFLYKAIPTKKEKDKNNGTVFLTTEITPFQMDTIYLGRRIQEEDLTNFFYLAQPADPGAFEAMGGWLKAYKLNKRGAYILRKEMGAMLKKPNGEVELD
ncbi:MAG: hypothetical protein LBL74_08040 [Bacteroidales bacterium]|jgi:hypothetical protein|nr:hypothetical protein [Bacteroidales bacterium]